MALSPEWRLLLACAKASLSAEDVRLIQQEAAFPGLDWDYVTRASCAHGIAPLVYHSLNRSDVIDQLPPAAADRLRNTFYTNAARNSLLYDELRRVLEAFGRERIECIVLKGAALAEIVYPQRALRAMNDIDLLVRKEKLAEVETQLYNFGYRLEEEAQREFYQEHHFHWEFTKTSSATVEIHWHFRPPTGSFTIDMDGLWERAQAIKTAGVDALALSPEDLLLHLCQHVWKHKMMGGIRPFCDIAETARRYGDKIDWQKMKALSSRWQMNPCSYLGLSLAKDLLGAPVPQHFLEGLRPENFDPAIIRWGKERLLAHGESSPCSSDLLEFFWKDRSIANRLAAIKRALSLNAGTTGAASPTDSRRIYSYYPRRIKYLITRYGHVAWRLVTGDPGMRAAAEWQENQMRLTKWLSSNE